MNTTIESTKTERNVAPGVVLLILAVGLAFFSYAHRPVEGFADAFQRADSWMFNPNVYYGLMFIAVMLGLAGAYRIFLALKK